jgi:hypothetical protein
MKLGIVTAIAIGSHKMNRWLEKSLPRATILLGLSTKFESLPHHNHRSGAAIEV